MSASRYSLAAHPEARHRALWLIRDYPHIKARLDALDGISAGPQDGQPHSHEPHSTVEADAIRRADLSAQLTAVDRAFSHIPPEYRKGLWDSIVHRRYYPDTAGIKTWKRWRQRLLWYVAKYAGFL